MGRPTYQKSDMHDATDGELVRLAQDGERAAFGTLVERYANRVLSVCRVRVGRRGAAEDLAQDTFLRAFRNLGTLVEPEKFGAWAYGIASRTCQDWLKSKVRTQVDFTTLSASRDTHDLAEAPKSESLEHDENRSHVLDAVGSLPEIYRDVVVLFYFEKQSYAAMAEHLGVTPAAVNARLHKARLLLRQRLSSVVEP